MPETVLVTGAASGIGAALVGLLLDDGWGVLALDRAPVPAAPGVETITCDLADPAQVAAVVARVRGAVSAVAHVAGVPGTAPAPTVLAVNVLAARLLVEPLLPDLDAVVTVASVAQHRSPESDDAIDELLACDDAAELTDWLARHPHSGSAAYDTSKKALVRWTRLTAGRHVGGTRLNAVSPGPVETPILGDFRTSMGTADIDRAAAAVGRHGRPEEVAAAVAFLLGPSASWVRGVDLPVEGGLLAARAAATATATPVVRNDRRATVPTDLDDRSTGTVVALDGTCPHGRERLGGKAHSVNRMRALGLPGPPAFAITTDVCARYRADGLPDDVWADVVDAVHALEADTGHRFADPTAPLLVSVRSGAAQSMPGMMDTVLDLGLTPAAVEGLATSTGDRAWAQDTDVRFRRSYTEVVDPAGPPDDPWEQLRAAIGAVFRSWDSPRARVYRDRYALDHDAGTAVTVQAMVFGNRDDASGTGVAFSRDPSTGEALLYGEWVRGGQGEDVVSGTVTPVPIVAFADEMPGLHAELVAAATVLEAEYRDMVDIEFTVESGRLFVLQARAGKRSPTAALRIAVELATAGTITPDEALGRLTPEQARGHLEAAATTGGRTLASGTGAGPGVASGLVVTDPDDALDADGAVVLVRPFTAPDDVPAMYASVAVVTEHGGTTSHAALVAREAGLPCVVGCGDGVVAALAGQVVTVDGARGVVLEGDVTGEAGPRAAADWESTLLGWAGAATLADLPGRLGG